jgi:hypothetical protein
MKIKCEYCGSYIDDTDEKCPNCGGVNSNLKRNADEAPHTIEELKQWYTSHNLPPENVTRFFIGKNYTGARAFGIYKDEATGNFVVYKNKSDASRAIRYQGKDESYAVNELYMKLKEEIVNQKQHNLNNANNTQYAKYRAPATPSAKNTIKSIIIFIIFFAIFISIVKYTMRPSRGYYNYDGNYYYYQSGTWYEYDYYSGWYPTYAPDELADNYHDYYSSSYYSSYYGTDDFSDSSYYIEPS